MLDVNQDTQGTLSLQDEPDKPELSLQDEYATPVPVGQAIDRRAQKADYALGQDSPGKDHIASAIAAGDEGSLRQGVASAHDNKLLGAKSDLLTQVAQTNGGQATPQALTLAQAVAQSPSPKTDPDTILEKMYADKYTRDVLGMADWSKLDTPEKQDAASAESDVASNLVTRKEWFQSQYENLAGKWSNTGWLSAGWQYVVNSVPFLPWWRQAAALEARPSELTFLPGTTIKDNVQWMYAQSLPDSQRLYKKAMDYFEDKGDILGAMQFTQALVSYSTSDEYLSNAMGLADWATAGSVLTKAGVRIVSPFIRKAEQSGARMTPTEAAKAVKEASGEKTLPPAAEAAPRPPEAQQLDLFGEQPEQGSFRFMTQAEQGTPSLESKLPPGKMRATHQTQFDLFGTPPDEYNLPSGTGRPVQENRAVDGKMVRQGKVPSTAFRQEELPFDVQPHQASLDLDAPIVKKPPEGGTGTGGTPSGGTPPSGSASTRVVVNGVRRPDLEATTAGAVQETKAALAEAVKANEGLKTPAAEEVLSAIGKVDEAGWIGAFKRLLNPLEKGNKDVGAQVPTFANPTGFYQDSKVIGRARIQALTPLLEKQVNQLADRLGPSAVGGLTRVQRLTPEALQVARRETAKDMQRSLNTRAQDALLDVTYTPAEAHPSNVETVTLRIGKPDMTLFGSAENADMYAKDVYKLGSGQYEIRNQGYGWTIDVAQHPDETADIVRDSLVTPRNSSNRGMIHGLLNRLRSADDTLGLFQRDNRQAATHAPQEIKRALKDYIDENILSLPKKSRQAVEDILRENRDMPSATNPSERGAWYNSAGEFETAFSARHNRLPNEKEVMAYDAYKRLSDFDWLLRNSAVYRDKARQGIMSFRYHTGEGGWSPNFEGKEHPSMPWSVGKADQDAGIWVHDSETGQGRYYAKFKMTPEQRTEIDDLVASHNYKVIQLFDPKSHPLQDIASTKAGEPLQTQINYVLTNTSEKSPLSWQQVKYRPGGHSIYPGQWYVAQPVIQERGGAGAGSKNLYMGDNNILNVSTRAEADKWSQRLDTARQLFRDGKTSELEAYVRDNLPHSMDQFYDLFRRSDSPLDINHPVTYKEAGKHTIDTNAMLKAEYDRGNLVNTMKNVHDLSNFMDKSYLMERDNVMKTITERGGIRQLVDAEQLDPYIAMNRAMNQALRNVWTTDYKISAVESWIKEFEHVMKPNERSLLAHPMFSLYNPDIWNTGVSSASRADLIAGQAAQRAIVNFIGSKSELGRTLDWLKMKALDTTYNMFGEGKMLDAALATTADPVHFLRGIAFHSKLGMFNPVQFFMQAQTMAHSIAIAGPDHGFRGMIAAPMIRWLGHNPTMLPAMDGFAAKFGWKPGMFTEMYQALQKTGLYQVAGEAAMRDDAFDPPLFRSKIGHILDTGAMFFNEGERMTRMTAFATAFREWRTANPLLAIGDRELNGVLRRADDLSLNMTRASNAAWQSGALSIPLQFYAWNARAMEQLIGGRLTGAEKLRILGTYSALYGIPMGAGMGVGALYPAYDSIKQEAMKRGINLDQGYFKPLTEGLLEYAGRLLTGKDYNTAQRYAPGNNPEIKKFFDGDAKWHEIAFGASGSIIGDIFHSLYPMLHNAYAVVSGDPMYNITSTDLVSVARNFSTFDNGIKAYYAGVYGKWYTKTGNLVSDKVDGMDAFAVALGLTPLHVANTFMAQAALRDQKKAQDAAVQYAQEEHRRGLLAASTGDWKTANQYFANSATTFKLGDLNFAQQAEAYKRLVRQGQPLEDKINWDAGRNAPASQQGPGAFHSLTSTD